MAVRTGWSVLAAVVAVVLLAVVAREAAGSPVEPEGYVVVIDAGSTGSRVHVHGFDLGHPLPTVYPSLSTKVKPGLSSFNEEPEEALQPLKDLVAFAVGKVPARLHSQTKIFLKATAGLRALPPDEAENLLRVARRVLRASPFQFLDDSWARVITGTEEGVYGWITVNYMDGALRTPVPVPSLVGTSVMETTMPSTTGLIEMGGASTQITFVPEDEVARNHPGTLTVRVGPFKFPLYTHSYMNYGLDEAMRLFDQVHARELELVGDHPCFPTDYETESGHTGSGDQARCSKMMESLFNKPWWRPEAPGFNGVWQPPITTEKFYAIENFFYTTEFFGGLASPSPFELVRARGADYCRLDWAEIPHKYKGEAVPDLAKYCFNSAYGHQLLKYGFGLDTKESKAQVVRHINGAAIDWALGAALHEVATHSPSLLDDFSIEEHPDRAYYMGGLGNVGPFDQLSVTIFGSLGIVVVLMAVRAVRKAVRQRTE